MIDFNGNDITFLAAEDMSTHQYRFVVQSADGTVRMADSATEFPIGILQNAPSAAGQTAIVRIDGTSKLVMNAAVAVGVALKNEYVSASDNGKGDAADTAGDLIRAYCIGASGAEDDVGAALLAFGRIHS